MLRVCSAQLRRRFSIALLRSPLLSRYEALSFSLLTSVLSAVNHLLPATTISAKRSDRLTCVRDTIAPTTNQNTAGKEFIFIVDGLQLVKCTCEHESEKTTVYHTISQRANEMPSCCTTGTCTHAQNRDNARQKNFNYIRYKQPNNVIRMMCFSC